MKDKAAAVAVVVCLAVGLFAGHYLWAPQASAPSSPTTTTSTTLSATASVVSSSSTIAVLSPNALFEQFSSDEAASNATFGGRIEPVEIVDYQVSQDSSGRYYTCYLADESGFVEACDATQ